MTHWIMLLLIWVPSWALVAHSIPDNIYLGTCVWCIAFSLPVLFFVMLAATSLGYKVSTLRGAPVERRMLNAWTLCDALTNWFSRGALLTNCGLSNVARLCVVVRGKETGEPRVIPLMAPDIDRAKLGQLAYALQGDVIAGSNMGASGDPQWVKSIRKMIELNEPVFYNYGQRIHSATPEEITNPVLREQLLSEIITFTPDFRHYIEDTKNERKIALFHLRRVRDFRWSDTVMLRGRDGSSAHVRLSDLFFPQRSPIWIRRLKQIGSWASRVGSGRPVRSALPVHGRSVDSEVRTFGRSKAQRGCSRWFEVSRDG